MNAAERPTGITVCIPSVRATTIADAVASVERQSCDDWELVIVMQGDDRELRDRVDELSRRESRIRGVWVREMGVSRARNLGVEAARHDLVAFLDDDCEAAPDWLGRIRAALAEQPDVGVIAGALVAPPGPRWPVSICPSASPADFTLRQTSGDPSMPAGAAFVSANLAVRREVWDLVGPFDELLGAGGPFRGGEDLDLLLRFVRRGVPIRFLPSAIVHHTHGRRFGIRPVLRMVTAYGSGQGAAAAKLTHAETPGATEWSGTEWRRHVWRGDVLGPLRTTRPHRVLRALPRALAFERAYRRCLRDFELDPDGFLQPRADPGA